MHTEEKLLSIASQFALAGEIDAVKQLGEGFINDSFVVKTKGDAPNYILQRKNKAVFPDVPAMMDNIERVTDHIRRKVVAAGGNPDREVLTVVKTKDGKLYHIDENAEVIKGFHNMRWRFTQWDEAVKADKAGRVASLAKEIGWIESRREQMLDFQSRIESGELPMRVTHNDTKISNILFDQQGDVLCVIDLDTVMSSTSLNDFGDAIRSYANTGAEDDKNLDNVELSLEMFEAYTKGYLSERKSTMTESEKSWLAFSAKFITFEQVLRFLMDYIDGDTYYKVAYPDHNLVRTWAQYKLLQSMEAQFDKMQQIVAANC